MIRFEKQVTGDERHPRPDALSEGAEIWAGFGFGSTGSDFGSPISDSAWISAGMPRHVSAFLSPRLTR